MPISSSNGAGSAGGDIQPVDTLGAFAQTMLAGVGGNASAPAAIANTAGSGYTGKVITSVLQPS